MMKKFLLSLLVFISCSAYADMDWIRRHWDDHPPQRLNYRQTEPQNILVPLVIGGIVYYTLTQKQEQMPQPRYEERLVYFRECDCYRKVLVQVN